MQRYIGILIWAIVSLVMALAVIAWGDLRAWNFDNLGLLQIFPLLGLLAFSLMWSHYAVAALKRRWPQAANYKFYYKSTAALVLALFLAHPSLLWIEGIRNNFSVFDYAPGQGPIIILGILALLTFLMYEVVERMQDKPSVQGKWWLVKALNNAAFVAIFFHGLSLGGNLQSGWYQAVWIFYGAAAAWFIFDGYRYDLKKVSGQ